MSDVKTIKGVIVVLPSNEREKSVIGIVAQRSGYDFHPDTVMVTGFGHILEARRFQTALSNWLRDQSSTHSTFSAR